MKEKEKKGSCIVYPIKKLEVHVESWTKNQLADFTNADLKPYLFAIAAGIKNALEEFHKCGYAHVDVRVSNVCYHNNKVTLIDLDRAL